MATGYDKIIDEMSARCELLREGETREACCKEKGIAHCPPLSQPEDLAYIFVIQCVAILIPIVFVCVALWLKWPQRVWQRFGETGKAFVSGWLIWIVLVISYVLIMQPYHGTMSDSEYANLLMWLTLPPLSAWTIQKWVRRFIVKK